MFEVDVDLDLDHLIVYCSKFLDHTGDHIIEAMGPDMQWHVYTCVRLGSCLVVSGQDFIVMEALRPQTFSGSWV